MTEKDAQLLIQAEHVIRHWHTLHELRRETRNWPIARFDLAMERIPSITPPEWQAETLSCLELLRSERGAVGMAAEERALNAARHAENVKLTKRAIRWAIWATVVGLLGVLGPLIPTLFR